ncbi:hypothetical protein D9758_018161 [Tetrapyrgos nigripes]|nr:hypothetical protein D9758_018161 [Tetrapyrgos nigripes]
MGEKDSRRVSGEGRRRTPLSEIFPDIHSDASSRRSSGVSSINPHAPMLTLEEATSDGHERDTDSAVSTPARRRPRPMSEQMLGRSRPQPVYDEDGEGVISILSAATNDLAQLINHLDLEATPGTTPGTPNISPWRQQMLAGAVPRVPDNNESPTKRTLRKDISSITSLRPYAQSRSPTKQPLSKDLLGQQIAPWPTLNSMFPRDSPKASSPVASSSAPKTRPKHKRTLSPPAPMLENSPPMIRPLRPAKSRSGIVAMKSLGPPPSESLPPIELKHDGGTVRAPSTLTFGSRTSSRGGDSSISSIDDIKNRPPVPVLPSAFGHARNRSSLLSSQYSSDDDNTTSRPLVPGARKMLGMKGTMGGSDVSAYAVDELDASDPDSDIPDELQNILARRHEDDTLSYRPPSPHSASPEDVPQDVSEMDSFGDPQPLDIPMFHLTDVNENQIDMDDIHSDEEGDTKKSFDFTGELKKLNESGASDRRSFMEQLESAFRTPAKLDLRYDFGGSDSGMLSVEVPPLPPLPSLPAQAETSSSTIQTDVSTTSHEAASGFSSQTSDMESDPVSRLLDVKEPTLLPGSDSLGSNAETDDLMMVDSAEPSVENALPASRPSDGQLNKAFKFGGMTKASCSPAEKVANKGSKLTLSDIIPPPSHVRSVSNASSASVGDSVIKSIIAEAAELPIARPRPRINSDSSAHAANTSVGRAGMQIQYRHSRQSSDFSFTGFDSFDEVRRGFEFHDYRPGFYPPPTSNNRRNNVHNRHESTFSIASISSYGHVLNPGIPDPFDYGLPSLRERPSSEDMTSSFSMNQSVDDTFSFIHRAPRRRVESDASDFYFNAPSQSFRRGHGRNESNMSIVSGPPVSLYNRSFAAAHRRNDSNSSVSSIAHSYALHGANGGRAAWARHRQEASVDSVSSDFSAMRLGRPGIGDKMFETAGAPLTSISASPTDSAIDLESRLLDSRLEQTENPSSFDSIMDTYQRSSIEAEDSLFDKTGDRASISSDSVFGYDFSRFPEGHLLPPPNFRPMSSFSMTSDHSLAKEDDTMISMIGGGHVRRRSVNSAIEASPCVRFGNKRKQPPSEAAHMLKENQEPGHAVKARIIEKASIASTSSSKFGDERMIKARKGLLERQSLEESVLMAEGEDLSMSFSSAPVFSRPGPASRSRSSTCTSMSSGADTPPLSASDGSASMSDGSQSSIDVAQLNSLLVNATHPVSTTGRNRLRARARGQGHRRRISQARMSRSSVYETIEEEFSSDSSSPGPQSKKSSPTAMQSVFVVDADTASIHSTESFWDDERGIVALRKYYDLRNEAEHTVSESKRVWVDTPFSVYALQTFNPPRQPSAMQALLQDSVQNYHPLPSELGPRRRRTQSRPSPYPQGRTIKVSLTSDSPRPIIGSTSRAAGKASHGSPLQEITVNPNLMTANHMPKYEANKPFATLEDDLAEQFPAKTRENAFGLASQPRPRVGSSARRTALGWAKRSTGKVSSELKENVGVGVSMTPGESLRLNRPRPRGRPTPARPSARV